MTTGIQLLRPSSLFSGAPYAYAAQAPPGSRFVFLAGACPLDSEGTTVGAGSYVVQAQAALDNLELALAAAAASITDVIFTRVLVATIDPDDLRNVWGGRGRAVRRPRRPEHFGGSHCARVPRSAR